MSLWKEPAHNAKRRQAETEWDKNQYIKLPGKGETLGQLLYGLGKETKLQAALIQASS